MTTLNGRILLAEDVPDNQRLLSHYLTTAGAHVTIAGDGAAAVAAALASRGHESPGLILMDMQMPGLDGLSATRLLRQEGWKGPIVALTANASQEDRAQCLAAGCDDYLTKPVDRDELIRRCAAWLGVGRVVGE